MYQNQLGENSKSTPIDVKQTIMLKFHMTDTSEAIMVSSTQPKRVNHEVHQIAQKRLEINANSEVIKLNILTYPMGLHLERLGLITCKLRGNT